MDPLMWLRTNSEVELEYLWLVAKEAVEHQKNCRIDLANRIIDTLSRAMGKKGNKSA